MENLLLIAIAIVGGLIGVLAFVAFILKIILVIKYQKYNRIQLESGMTSFEACDQVLKSCDLNEVKVTKSGALSSWLFGNRYIAKSKTIKLRPNISDKCSITAVGVGLEKVGLAIQHNNNDKRAITYLKLQRFVLFVPFMIVPMVIVGIIIDAVVKLNGVCAIVFTIIAIIFYLFTFIFSLLQLPVETKAQKQALSIVEQTGIMNEEETFALKKIFEAYKLEYIINFIMAILYMIYYVLKIILFIIREKARS